MGGIYSHRRGSAKEKSEKELTLEIGSNSDLILENTITNNLVWTIENFKKSKKGYEIKKEGVI